jgi:hypothetical protein
MAVFLLSFGLGAATLLFTALDRLLLHPLAPKAIRQKNDLPGLAPGFGGLLL